MHGNWHLFIRPRHPGNGGFEPGTGVMIKAPQLKDDAVTTLREID